MLTGYVKGMRMAKTDRIAIGPSLFLASGCRDAGCGNAEVEVQENGLNSDNDSSPNRYLGGLPILSLKIVDNFGASFRISTRNFGAYLLPLLLANLAILPMLKF
jgi:hypothetical protein